MSLSLITVNISADFLTPPGVPAWDERKHLLAEVLCASEPNLIGIQEATPRQIEFLRSQLPGYTALTVPMTDPDPEMVRAWQAKYAKFGWPTPPDPYEIVLLYHTQTFELLASDHWWLSPTPQRPSMGFGNVAPRAVLWAHLKHKPTEREFIIFNTHIDHRAIGPMLELCRVKIAAFAERGLPLIFSGDFNFNPNDSYYNDLMDDGWQDTYSAAGNADASTFLYTTVAVPTGRIDHILYRGKGLQAEAWARIESPDPKRRLSDHNPVYARLSFENNDAP